MHDAPRVAIVGPAPPFRGGIAQHTARLAEQFARDGADVSVESWARQYPRLLYRRTEHEPGVSAFPGARFSLRWFDIISWIRAGRRVRRVDHLVLQWVTPFHFLVYVVLRLVASPESTTVIVHNARPHERFPLVPLLTTIAFKGVDRVVCHAEAVSAELDELGVEVPRTEIVDMPPLVATSRTPLPERPPTRLLFLGYLRPYKGADIAVSALASVMSEGSADEVTLTVAGEPWSDGPSIAEQAARLGVAAQVTTIERYLSDDEMGDLLTTHHALVAPYRSATQSGVVALALASGRPVIATEVGGISELVTDGVSGVLCRPDDVEMFAAAIDRAIGSLEVLAEGAAEFASDWSAVTSAITRA